MAARREGASRGDSTSGSVYTTCFSWSTSITTAPSSECERDEGHVKHRYEREAAAPGCISRTFALEDIAAASFQPRHVFEAQEGGVHAEARTTLPNPVHVAGTHL